MTTLSRIVRATPGARRTAVTAVFFANGLGIGAWAASLPTLMNGLGLDEATFSLVLLGFAVGAVAAMPLAGWFGPLHGSGRATWVSGLAFAAALALPPLAPSLGVLIAIAVLIGAANGALDVSMNAHASGIERGWGQPIMSSFHAAFSLGGLAGAAAGGLLATYDPNAILWMPATAAAVLVAGFAPDLGPGERHTEGPRLVAPSRAALLLCSVALICMLIEGAMADWSAVYLATIGERSTAAAAAGYAAFSLAMAAGRLVGDRIVAALGRARVIGLGAVLSAIGLAIATVLPGPLAIVGFAAVGLGLSNVVPAVFSAAARTGASAAAGVAMAATAGYAGFLAGPPLIGAVASLLTLQAGIALLAGAAVLVAVLARALR